MGRPKKTATTRKVARINVRVTPDEYRVIMAHASRQRQTLTQYARERLLIGAGR